MHTPDHPFKRKSAPSASLMPVKAARRSPSPVSDEEGEPSVKLGAEDGGDPTTEPAVTKRTLQNRKAQREFRKRREARVRDLEERCRRFDQMGLEANAELQRIARRLKDENEALRSLLVRLGFANMIPSAIERCGTPSREGYLAQAYNSAAAHASSSAAHPNISFDASQASTSGVAMPSDLDLNMNMNLNVTGLGMSNSGNTTISQHSSSNAADSNAQRAQHRGGDNSGHARSVISPPGISASQFDWPTATPNGFITDAFRASQEGTDGQARPALGAVKQRNRSQSTVPQIINIEGAQRATTRHSPSAISDGAEETNKARAKSPLLSLRGLSGTQASANAQEKQQQQRRTPYQGSSQASNMYVPGGTAGPHGGAGVGGSAMLGLPASEPQQQYSDVAGSNHGHTVSMTPSNSLFPFPQRTYQNDALLNPNPIPFAFNLSNNASHSPPDQSWWEAMCGGGMLTPGQDPTALDEKAQVVAAAQQQSTTERNSGGPSGMFGGSPIDFSAFLSGGFTPTGVIGSNFDGQQSSDVSRLATVRSDPASMEKKLSSSPSMPPPMPPTAHAQMFLRLIERKLASRDPSPYASLGFQPPSMYQNSSPAAKPSELGSRSATSGWRLPSSTDRAKATTVWRAPGHGSSPQAQGRSSMTPSSVYTRLAQHPAFLNTSEKELEELVDAIEPRHSDQSLSNGRASSSAGRSDDSLDRRPASQSSTRSSDDFFTNASRQKNAVAASHTQAHASNVDASGAGSNHADSRKPSGAAAAVDETRSPRSGGMELDENAVTQILDMLDAKRRGGQRQQTGDLESSGSNSTSAVAA